MKRIKLFICFALLFCFLGSSALFAYAEDYTDTVRLYAGNRGAVKGENVVVYDGLHAGDRVTFSLEDVEVFDSVKYYAKGFRESGRDNDTVGASSFVVTRDIDYVVAYGVRGDQVSYTVRYLDQNGNKLAPDATYYGNVGDKPAVAFVYIDGYHPQAYNLTKTLSANEAENVLSFTYYKAAASGGNSQGQQPASGSEGGSAPQSGGTETAPPADTQEGSSATDAKNLSVEFPQEIIDLDEPGAPVGESGGSSGIGWLWIPLAAVLLALIGGLIAFIQLRSRRKNEEDAK